uniref:Uncharacterized protein n=1 Tax=Arundo donax TaxID=35708 RepID=A0A0A9FXA8_ARUDO
MDFGAWRTLVSGYVSQHSYSELVDVWWLVINERSVNFMSVLPNWFSLE